MPEVTLPLNNDDIEPGVVKKMNFLTQAFLRINIEVVAVARRRVHHSGEVLDSNSRRFTVVLSMVLVQTQDGCGVYATSNSLPGGHGSNPLQYFRERDLRHTRVD